MQIHITEIQHWHFVGTQQIIYIFITPMLHSALILHLLSISGNTKVRFSLGKGLLTMDFRS